MRRYYVLTTPDRPASLARRTSEQGAWKSKGISGDWNSFRLQRPRVRLRVISAGSVDALISFQLFFFSVLTRSGFG
jgi:hypothetical protein